MQRFPRIFESMKNHLDGMFWDAGAYSFEIPYLGNRVDATKVLHTNLAQIVWNSLRTLENNPTSLPQTRTILQGQSVGDLSIFDLLQVKNYGDATRHLINLVYAGEFQLDIQTACRIHAKAAQKEALEWGCLRNGKVSIENVEFVPPPADRLPDLAKQGFAYLARTVRNPKERAVAVFLFMSRSQFFWDANKRTASLMMNGCLMDSGYAPITVLNQNSALFHKELQDFYETGDANGMVRFFADMTRNMYKDFPKTLMRPEPDYASSKETALS